MAVFKLIDVTQQMEEALKTPDPRKLRDRRKALQEVGNAVNQMTEVMFRDPIYFKESEGRWIGWAVTKALAIFDQLNGNAKIIVKSAKLRIRQEVPRSKIVVGRANPRELFSALWDIDRLLEKNFEYDPWTTEIRRGRIGADMAKR